MDFKRNGGESPMVIPRSRPDMEDSFEEFLNAPRRLFTPPPARLTGFWILHNSRWPFLRLDIPFDREALLAEAIEYLKSGHFGFQNASEQWRTFFFFDSAGYTLHDPVDLLATLREQFPFKLRPPVTPDSVALRFAQSLPFETVLGIQYHALMPGGIIVPHRDHDEPGLSRFIFALTQPEGALTYFENFGVAPYQAGAAFAFDPSVKHAVVNTSGETRYYMQMTGFIGNRAADLEKLAHDSYLKFRVPENL